MEADDKPFACSFAGCNMRFTNEDHLTVHKKKHDMVLNLGNGQKSNVFVADQTPTPTRFIRNCEEVGLFQDLQNVNPFEETFRKAVEAVKTGVGPLHEVDALSEPTGTDDTLHTPHVFPHIIEDSTSNSSSAYKSVATTFISSTSIITENGKKKCSDGSTSSVPHQELDQLLHPTSTTGDSECHGEIITGDMSEERRVLVQLGSSTKVVRQEADTSQHNENSRQIITSNTGIKNGLGDGALSTEPSGVTPPPGLSNAGSSTVQLLLRMPDGKLLQLSALPVEHVTPSGQNNVVHLSQVDPQPVPGQNATVLVTTTCPAAAVAAVPVATVGKNKKPISAVKTSSAPVKQPTGLSLAKLRLKQTLISNNRSAATAKELPPKQSTPKVLISEVSKTAPEAPNASPASVASSRRTSSSSGGEDPEEKRQKFLERNRAAAVRCREKRKTWIQELERRAEEMLATNQQLQSEVASLRKEVADLKSLLLAHKDCPVTQAMVQGSGVPLSSGVQPEQPQIIAVPVTSNTDCLLPSAQHTTHDALVQQHPTTARQNQLILVNGTTNHKRGCNEPILLTKKQKPTTNQGTPLIHQAILLPSPHQVVNNSAVKTVTGVNKNSRSVSVAMQSGVLVTSPIITAANQLSVSAVIQNSNYQQTFIVPEVCLPVSVTDVERIIHGNHALSAEIDAHSRRKMGEVSNVETGSHVIKINPNVMRKSTDSMITHELTTDIATSSDADSDIEIITEIGSDNHRR